MVEAQKRPTNDNVVITVNEVIQTTTLYPRFVVGILFTQNGEGCLRKAKAHVRRPVYLSGFEIGDQQSCKCQEYEHYNCRFKPYAWLLGLITSNTGHHTLVLA